ncbi:polysaccharide lyase [Vibrio metschnikovii]|uniref:polysaccharide lyase n=1 Tax=Vibrio metschnikovii TaxID=28172 RepID=UPI002FCA053E
MFRPFFFAILIFLSGFSAASEIKGVIDSAKFRDDFLVISGWACQVGYDESVDVHLYVGGAAGKGTLVKGIKSNLKSETAVTEVCKSNGDQHRFKFYLDNEEVKKFQGKSIYVHGISLIGSGNRRLNNSGSFTVPAPQINQSSHFLFKRDFSNKPTVFWNEGFLKSLKYDGKDVVRVTYEPYERGSKRVLGSFPLNRQVTEATLSYDVRFHKDFEFVRGGKLHGLRGTGSLGSSGCYPIEPDAWSVRVTWTSSGKPVLYIYDQDRTNRCGHVYKGQHADVKFETEKWYRVDMYMKMNTGPYENDGIAELYINGQQVAGADGIRFTENMDSLISIFSFSTFHGGSSPANAPSKTVYSYFDFFTVKEGKVISGRGE